ncbi:hypothetical protein QBC45DRAFT_461069 [Copromyces sp. CBS 386.78]|nr:hypothetical protein QBC45DRAFT_461069 [Copromyces sp. CBS 386.78]
MGDPPQPRIWRLTDHFLPVQQLPRWLYYVRHADSLTSFAPNGDILTNHPVRELVISSRDHLDALVRQHLHWQSRGTSPFISAFIHKGTACDWGRQRNPMQVVYTIDSRKLPKGWPVVYAAVHTHNPYDAEFVFLTYIPYAAIIDIHTIHSPTPEPVLLAPPATAHPSVSLIPVTPHAVPPPPYQEAYPPLLGNRFAPMPAPAPTPPPIRSLPSYNDESRPLQSRRIAPTAVPAPSPPPVRSPPSYEAPQHFASPPYTTPARYITAIPPTATPPQAPPAAETDGAYAQSDPGNPGAPEQESSTVPSVTSPPQHTSPGHTPGYITPGQIMSGQNTPAAPVRFPPPVLPRPTMDDTAVPEPQGSSVTEPPMASDPGPSVEAGPVDEAEPAPGQLANPSQRRPETPVDNPETSAQSQPETSVDKPETPVQSNPETPVHGTGEVNNNFFAEYSNGGKSDSQNPGISNSPSPT